MLGGSLALTIVQKQKRTHAIRRDNEFKQEISMIGN
jgi:hypothetical protein